MQKNQFDKNGKKVGYLVHLDPIQDNSIELYLESQVVSAILEETTDLKVAEYLSYKNNPSAATDFMEGSQSRLCGEHFFGSLRALSITS